MRIKARIISVLVTVTLVLTYTPMVTFADSTASLVSNVIDCLIDEDIDAAQYYNQQLPEIATEACTANMSNEMKISYGNVVKSWEDVKQYDEYAFRDYWLTDIDNDGFAELLVNLGPGYADALTHVYQYKNGQAVEIGTFSGNFTCHAFPDNNGIVTECGKMGYNWLSLITIENGALEQEQLISYGDGYLSWDEYFHMRNMLKTHSKWNGDRYIPIYDDLIDSKLPSSTPGKKSAAKVTIKKDLPVVKITSAKSVKKVALVKWKKVSKKNQRKIAKVQIQYSRDKKFKKGVKKKLISARKTSYKIKGLKSNKKYYIRVRAYTKTGTTKHVSKWSAVKTVKVK